MTGFNRRRSSKLVAASLAFAALGSVPAAHGSSSYPPEVQKALDAQFGGSHCVPQCITCHRTNEGGIDTLNVFGKNLKQYGGLPLGRPSAVVGAFDTYFKSTPTADATVPLVNTVFENGTPTRPFYDSDSDGVSDYTEMQQGDSPSVAGDRGVGALCPADAPMYGCFARVAAAPPTTDRLALFRQGWSCWG